MRVNKTSAGTGSTPLHYACLRKNVALAKKLIDAGANVNVRDLIKLELNLRTLGLRNRQSYYSITFSM